MGTHRPTDGFTGCSFGHTFTLYSNLRHAVQVMACFLSDDYLDWISSPFNLQTGSRVIMQPD